LFTNEKTDISVATPKNLQNYRLQQPIRTRDLALASMARDDSPASSTVAAMRGKVGSEFDT